MKVRKLDDLSYMVKNGGSEYLVWYNRDRWTCDCMGYMCYAPHNPLFKCKHIKMIEKILNQ